MCFKASPEAERNGRFYQFAPAVPWSMMSDHHAAELILSVTAVFILTKVEQDPRLHKLFSGQQFESGLFHTAVDMEFRSSAIEFLPLHRTLPCSGPADCQIDPVHIVMINAEKGKKISGTS